MRWNRREPARFAAAALIVLVALLQVGAVSPPYAEIVFPEIVQRVTDDFITVSGIATNADYVLVKLNDWDWLPAEGNAAWHLKLPLAVGANSIWAKAVRLDGTESLQDYTIAVRVTPPGPPAINVPVNGSTRGGSRAITAEGTAPAGTHLVLFRANADEWRDTSGTLNWSAQFQAANGVNVLEAVARTEEGLQSSIARITFTYNAAAQAGAEDSEAYE